MAKIANRAKMTVSGTPGTGSITLGTASSGFQSFSDAGVLSGDLISYVIEDGSKFEIGRGTYNGTTLTRTALQSSELDGSKITATSAATVFLTVLAQDFSAPIPAGTATIGSIKSITDPVTVTGTITANVRLGGADINKNNPLATTLVFDSQTVSVAAPLPVSPTGFNGTSKVTNDNPFPVLISTLKAVAIEGPNGSKVTAANALPVAVSGTVATTLSGTPAVTISGTVPVSLSGTTPVSLDTSTTPLQVTVTNPSSGGGGGGSAYVGANFTESQVTASNATFTGTSRANPGGSMIFVTRISTTAATGSVTIQQSTDGTNWTSVRGYGATFAVSNNVTYALDATAAFYRVLVASMAANNTITVNSSFTAQSIDAVSTVALAGTIFVTPASVGSATAETSTSLAANAVFTSGIKLNNPAGAFSTITAHSYSDQSGLLRIEFSTDNSNWYRASAELVTIGGVPSFTQVPVSQTYMRIVYTNGPTAQTYFRLSCFLSKTGA